MCEENKNIAAAINLTNVVHFSSYYTHLNGHKNVQIIHDLIPEIYRGNEPVWTHKKQACLAANRIISVSQNTALDFHAFYPEYGSTNLFVIPNGLPVQISDTLLAFNQSESYEVALKHGLKPSRYFLFVGGRKGWNGYKNALVVAQAFNLLKAKSFDQEFADVQLCFVGGDQYLEKEILRAIHPHFYQDVLQVKADDMSLLHLLSASCALVYPSIYEGFGLPVLEALAVGCPVLASNAASIPEAGSSFVSYFNPFNKDALHVLMREILVSDLSTSGHKQFCIEYAIASLDNWKSMADCIVDLATSTSRTRNYHQPSHKQTINNNLNRLAMLENIPILTELHYKIESLHHDKVLDLVASMVPEIA